MKNDNRIESRRDFLGRALAVWASLTSLPFFYAIAKFVYPPIKEGGGQEDVMAGRLDEIPPNTSKIVRFNKKPVIIVHTTGGQLKAFAANCTHLGCVVEYRGDDTNFHCNCHGSVFDLDGKNIRGPAPSPLQVMKVSLKGTDVVLSVPTNRG